MLYEEAKWIGKQIDEFSNLETKLLNVGSSSLASRTIVQPHMEKYIFGPLRGKNIKVIHTDIQKVEGVDLVGDLTDKNFISELKSLKLNFILCSNLLEHIEGIKPLTEALEDILPPSGHYIFSVPYVYPYHKDPIDTMFRPSIKELASIFPSLTFIKGEHVNAKRKSGDKFEENYFETLKNNPQLAITIFIRCFLPFYKYKIWKYTVRNLREMFKPYQVTCIVLKKN